VHEQIGFQPNSSTIIINVRIYSSTASLNLEMLFAEFCQNIATIILLWIDAIDSNQS